MHIKFSDGPCQKKMAKNGQKTRFLLPLLLLVFSIWMSYKREHLVFYSSPAIFKRITPKCWRKFAKTTNHFFLFLEILSEEVNFYALRNLMVWDCAPDIWRLIALKIWWKLAKNRQNHVISCLYLILGFTTQELCTDTFWKPLLWSCAHKSFRRTVPKNWQKTAKKKGFFCPFSS